MKIGILLPAIYTANRYLDGRIFAPLTVAKDLADGLVGKGHEVFFYTSKDVVSKAHIVKGDENLTDTDPFYYQFRYRDSSEQKYATLEIIKRDFEYDLTMRAYKDAQSGNLDILHSFHDFGAHYFNELTNFPTVYTLHDPIPQTKDTIEYHRLFKFKHHNFISISNFQRKGAAALNFVATIYHGLKLDDYEFQDKTGEYLIYFGRLLEDKGADLAIQAAIQTDHSLHIATSDIRSNRSEGFYKTAIEPFLDDPHVTIQGFLEGKEKSDYIKNAKAFLMPLRWDEPFGLVMLEAMACGTPVIAYNRGSVSEIVRDGVTGFIIDPDNEERPGKGTWVIKKQGIEGLKEAIGRIREIDRKMCRKHVEENFTVEKMVEGYEKVYKNVLASQGRTLQG